MNIAEILKNCPKGTKLYSPVYGEIQFLYVDDIKFKVGDVISDGFSHVTVESVQEDSYIVRNEEIENDAHMVNWVIYFKDQDKWKLVKKL